ncbi:MAG: tRNA (N(6)-L-threonylcarbamoyladenosine(37)-C(2))-methylthiotransferase MtaB [Oscillospiraceae bacterium]
MKVAFYTLGCKVNQNETGALTRLFSENGYEIAEENEKADIYIVNSCTVTAGGDKKSRQWLRRAKREQPNAVTVLTGCFPQAFPESAMLVTEADIITGSAARGRILENVRKFLETKERIVDITPHIKGEKYEELPMEDLKGHTRAFVKIEDGCDRHCTYCVIPKARGNVRSRAESDVLKELTQLGANGFAEAVFTGINLSSYGKDTNTNLEEICEKAALVSGIKRIRFGSLEPDLMSDECIMRLSKIDAICPQFHLSLQSGCDRTLKRMARMYTAAEYEAVVNKLRKAFPNAVFTTDIIVGFPDESDEDFNESMAFIEKIGFLKVHVFSYSRREGTAAAKMPQQIHEDVKLARSRAMQKFADSVRAKIIGNMYGTQEQVLLETPINADTFTGYTRTYVPVLVKTKNHKQGDIVPVTLGEFDGERAIATITE